MPIARACEILLTSECETFVPVNDWQVRLRVRLRLRVRVRVRVKVRVRVRVRMRGDLARRCMPP